MKSPAELAIKLRRQWNNASKRESRLLHGGGAWPIVESIGQPRPRDMTSDLDSVIRHKDQWSAVKTGEVIWASKRYRATSEPVNIPVKWKIHKPSDWITACADSSIRTEFEAMAQLAEQADPVFHSLLIRRRSLWRDKPIAEVLQACRLAMTLEAGIAKGQPLRTLSLEGIDTKFFERNASLVTKLLDTRYEGEVSKIGLEVFLDALNEGDHWLLVVDLDGHLLPFKKQRIASADLATTALPGQQLIIVENESCQHQLPALPNTIAVLGAGFDLDWTANPDLHNKKIAYWGDIDTWGLLCLSKAKRSLPGLTPLMMNHNVYQTHADAAVPEPVVAGTDSPIHLNENEKLLYQFLLTTDNGRLEQEFLSYEFIQQQINHWSEAHGL